MRALVVAAVLALATPAAAQDMPDPRSMHGRARPEGQVPIGSVQVRVIHGDLARNAPEGHPVHFVHVGVDGKVERTTQGIDKNGRATFADLALDRSQAYYAFTLLGDDRLESELIVPTKMMGGMRVALVGRKLDKDGAPIGDVVDDALVDVGPASKPPAGEAFVVVLGQENVEVELIEVPAVGQAERVIGKSRTRPAGNNQHIARFSGLASGPDHVYMMRLVEGDKRFYTKPFMMSASAGAGRSMLAIGKPILGGHIAAELDDELLRFQAQYNLQNYSGLPIDTGTEGIVLPLPEGAVGGQAGEENAANLKMTPGVSVTWRGILLPGPNTFIIGFALPIHQGVATYKQELPLGLFESMVIVEKPAGASLDIGSLRVDSRQNELGRSFFVVPRVDLVQGSLLEFTVKGLPRPRAADRWARVVVGFLVVLVLVGAVVATLAAPGRRAGGPAAGTGPASRRKQLTAEREKLYDQLVELEKKRAAARVDADDYASAKQSVVARLTLVLHELDQLDAGSA